MVDIIIGSVDSLGHHSGTAGLTGALVEAELLHVRDPRQRVAGPQGQERRRQPRRDPANGKVLTLLIPDSAILPKDLETKKYKVLLRFIKK
ncbi:MAG: hypothetical protein FWD79_01260 [Desulfobulbus sp.]|nr:hypothetical protein [Desulfobulbus sp.]